MKSAGLRRAYLALKAGRSPGGMPFEFNAVCLIMAAASCNISVFYGFYHFLGAAGITAGWQGFLVGLQPMSAFLLRLPILPWLNAANAPRIILLTLPLLMGVSFAYLWAGAVPGLIVLRIVHGGIFALLTSAIVFLAANLIPEGKSGRGFGTLSLAAILPYALIPLLAEAVLPHVRSDADVYAASSVFSLAAILLMLAVRRRVAAALRSGAQLQMRNPTSAEIRANLRHRPVAFLLLALLLAYFTHAVFFFFLKNLSIETGAGDVGLFFGISMSITVLVRTAGARLFDLVEKAAATRGFLVLAALCAALLPHAGTPATYYGLAVLYGLSIGVILPLLNALLFAASPPVLRGLNTNLAIFPPDIAYFLIPYAGGVLIAWGAGFDGLFYLAAGSVLAAAALIKK